MLIVKNMRKKFMNVKKLNKKYKNHKSVCDLLEDTPFPFGEKGYPDCDIRTTYNLDSCIFYFLYENLKIYKEIAPIDFDFNKFNINKKEMTLGECVDRMVSLLEDIIKKKDDSPFDKNLYEDICRDTDELFLILKEVIYSLWW